MDDVLDLVAVYNEFDCEPAAMATEIARLRRELVATASRALSAELRNSDLTLPSIPEFKRTA